MTNFRLEGAPRASSKGQSPPGNAHNALPIPEYFRISKRMKYVGQHGYGVRVLLVTLLQPAPGAGGQPGTKGACAKGGSCWKPSGLQRGSALPAGRGSQPHRGVMGMCPGGSLTSPSAVWY